MLRSKRCPCSRHRPELLTVMLNTALCAECFAHPQAPHILPAVPCNPHLAREWQGHRLLEQWRIRLFRAHALGNEGQSCEGVKPKKPFSWACRWPSSPCVSPWLSPLCLCPNLLYLLGHSRVGLGSILIASFNLNYLFKDLISKYGHILRDWREGLQHTHFGWHNSVQNTSQPQLAPAFPSRRSRLSVL